MTTRTELKSFMDGLRDEFLGKTGESSGKAAADARVAGPECVEDRIAAKVDEIVQRLMRRIRIPSGFAVLAIGGYGRRTLHPYSDIDLLLFFTGEPEEAVVKAVLHPLWDLGIDLSPQVRSAADFHVFDPSLLHSYTAFLDSRFVAGDDEAAAAFVSGIFAEFLQEHRQVLLHALVLNKRSRHAQYGDTVFQLEPDLKDAPGGLRDAHWSMWVKKLLHGPAAEPLRPQTLRFHHRLRNFLHFQTGRNHNVLEYDFQEQIAPQLGYRDSDHGDAAENLMRDYFLKAGEIVRLAAFWEETVAGSPNSVAVSSDFSDPFDMIEAFAEAHRRKARLDSATLVAIRQRLVRMNGVFGYNPKAGKMVLDMMKDRPGIYDALIGMHDVGLLGKIFPDFEEIRCRVIRDFFHKYTVDEHSLIAIRNIEQLPPSHRLSQVLEELQHPEFLLLSLLFHDIGKAHRHEEGNHVHPSTESVRGILARLDIPEEQVRRVVFVVKHHLEMSKIILRRDFSDEQVVNQFADLVGDLENLRMLCLVTYADMKAVNNEVMTPWKEDLLWQLYVETYNKLALGLADDRYSQQPSLENDIREIAELLPEGTLPQNIRDFLDGFPRRYLKTTPKPQIAEHFLLSRKLSVRPMVMHLGRSGDVYELLVMTADRLFLFSKITGVLSYFGMNIVRGQAFSNCHGTIFDLIAFEDSDRLFEKNPTEVEHLASVLDRVIGGELKLSDLLRGKFASIVFHQPKKGNVPTAIHFDDIFSKRCTLMEIVTQDAFALLYRIANVISSHGCNIEVALISTEGHRAIDVFYLTRDGKKLSPALQTQLEMDIKGEQTA